LTEEARNSAPDNMCTVKPLYNGHLSITVLLYFGAFKTGASFMQDKAMQKAPVGVLCIAVFLH